MSAPVPHTCPLIDSVINCIQDQITELKTALKEFENGNTDVCTSIIEDAISYLSDLVPAQTSTFSKFLDQGRHIVLEEIREANSLLREWGEDLEEDVRQAEDKISTLEAEIERLEYQITNIVNR